MGLSRPECRALTAPGIACCLVEPLETGLSLLAYCKSLGSVLYRGADMRREISGPVSTVCMAIVLCALPLLAAEAPTFEFTIGVGDFVSPARLEALKKDPRVVRVFEDGACGPTITLRSSRMPGKEETDLSPLVVTEYSLKGEILRQWPVPIDENPISARRDEILIDNYGEQMWISTDGSLRAGPSPKVDIRNTGGIRCPESVSFLLGGQCLSYPDMGDGRPRYFDVREVCT